MAISFACFWDHGLFLASSPTNTESFGNCIRTSPDYFLGVSVVISKWHHYRSGSDRQITWWEEIATCMYVFYAEE